MEKYPDIRDHLQTGDIVLFSGKSLFSTSIKLSTNSPWSHCGMVHVLDNYDFVTVWESTLDNVGIADIQTGMLKKGVQLVPLSYRVQQYSGEIAIRQLTGVTLSANDLQSLMSLRKTLARKPYENNVIELIESALDIDSHENTEDLTALFCSELLAEAYQELGLLSEEKPSNEYTPADFSEKAGLKLLKGQLGPELIIKSA